MSADRSPEPPESSDEPTQDPPQLDFDAARATANESPSSRPTLVDEPVRERVRRTGLHETLFVEAGAGSGKTTLLVERIVNLVLEAGESLSTIAAITFTEAAASELQSRIRAEFEKAQAAADATGDRERAERCRRAIADTDLAAITTLHGFANRILREFAVSAGLPPRIRVLDEVSSQLAQQDRWQRFVDGLYANPELLDLLQAASALQIPIEPRYADQITMRTVGTQFNQNWDRLDALINTELPPLGQDFDLSRFDGLVEQLAAMTHLNLLSDDKLHLKLQEFLPEMRAIANIDEPLRKLRALQNAPGWRAGNLGRAAAWSGADTVGEIRRVLKEIEACTDEVLAPIIDDVLKRLSQLIAAQTRQAAEARRSDGGLEFHDLLVLARDLLRTDPGARQRLHDRYRRLLLDEFQDTDPIQIELAMLIATDAADVVERPWHELPVEPGRLFFVGDPKQSIYRFRRADIALFLQARDRFTGPNGSAQLESNFRTVEPIVAWVNALFVELMAHEVPGAQPGYQPLVADRRPEHDHDAPRHRPVLLGGPNPDDKIRATDLRAIEAEDVAGTIRAIIADPAAWPVFDRRRNAWRDAELDDITILLPTRTSLPFLRAELDAAGLRYRIATGTLVYDTQEVADALAAMRAIDDPGDELSLVAALRSPLYGCSDVDLAVWRRNGGRWDVRASTPDDIADTHPVAQAIAHLYSLWRDRWFLTPSSLLERLLRERHAALLAFGDPRTTDVWRRLRFLVEQARAFEESESGDVRAFTEWAALQSGSMARVHEPMLPETDEAALNIQTIHGSKGLEFPITILSGMTTQLGRRRSGVSVLWGDDGRPSVRMKGGVETGEYGPLADLETAMDEYETVRLAYVAATRARDHLIVSCHHKRSTSDKTYGGMIWNVFDTDERREFARGFDWREVVDHRSTELRYPAQLGLALDDRQEWLDRRSALLAPFRVPRVLSATGVAAAAIGSGTGAAGGESDQDDDGADLPEPELVARRRGRTGSAIGSAVHAVLELVELADPHGVGDLVAQQCEIEGISDRTGVVRRLVESALESDAVATAATNPHHKELFVTAPFAGRIIEGYVDLLIETAAGLVVVDYKTDSVRSEADVDAACARYELQAASYAVALEAITAMTVSECRFVFCTTRGPIERSVVDLDAATQRVRATIRDLAGSESVRAD